MQPALSIRNSIGQQVKVEAAWIWTWLWKLDRPCQKQVLPGGGTWEELQSCHDRYWAKVQPAFKKKRWELVDKYLLKMWETNESFVVRKGATLSPEQLRYVKLCAMDKQ